MDTPPNPRPMPQPKQHRNTPRKIGLPVLLGAVALLSALGGWGMGQLFSGGSGAAPLAVTDNLPQEERPTREQIPHAFPHFSVTTVPKEEMPGKIASLPLPPEQKAQLEQSLAHHGGQRLVELVVWGNVAIDGNVIQVNSLGYSQQVTLGGNAQTLTFPVEDGVPVVITGVHDDSGVTPGFTGSPPQASYTPPAAPPAAKTPPPAPVTASNAPTPASFTPQPAGNAALVLQPTAALPDSLSRFPKVDNSWGAVLRNRGRIPQQGFDAYYLTTGNPPKPSRSPFPDASPNPPEISLNSDFGYYADLWKQNRKRMVYKENVPGIAVNYAWNELHNIPSQTFAAYWVGQLEVAESGTYHFRSHHGHSNVRVLLNRHRILEATTRSSGKEISLHLDKGAYLLEVEYVNGWHTTNFSLDISSEKHLLQTADLLSPLATLKLPADTVVYAASVESASETDRRITLKYPAESRPYLLLLSSSNPVRWNIYGNNPPRAIIYNNAQKGSEVNAEHQPPGIPWSGKFDYRDKSHTPSCRCRNGQLLCEGSMGSLEKTAADIEQWTGYPLAGISGAYHATTLPMPQTIVTAQTIAQHRGNTDYIDRQRQLCQRLSGK